jgi:outer membrane protein TolC
VQLLDARSTLDDARRALVLLTNAQVGSAMLEDAPELPIGGEPNLDLLKQLALSQRQDLIAARWARDSARRSVEVAVGQYYPSASLNLRYFLYRETEPTERDWDSVLTLNLPVFSAGQIEADVRQAWSQFRQATLTEQQLRRQINNDVEAAYGNYRYSVQRYDELQTQVRAAKLAWDQAEASFNVGLATNLERLTAQDQYLSAQLQLTRELYNFRGYASNLLRVIGGLRSWWEHPAAVPLIIGPATEPSATQPVVPAAFPKGGDR